MSKRLRNGAILVFIAVMVFTALLIAVDTSQFCAAGAYDYNDTVFVIKSQSDFDSFATFAKTNNRTFDGRTVKLFTDVDASSWNFKMSDFRGVFKGYGHSLYNVTTQPFGTISGSVYDLNVHFADANAFADENKGVTENVGFFGTIKAKSGVTFSAPFKKNSGTVKNCVNGATVGSAINNVYFAGIAVDNTGVIEDCAFVGKFVFGVNLNAVSGIAVNKQFVSGVANAVDSGTIKNCAVVADFSGADSGVYDYIGNAATATGNAVAAKDGSGSVYTSFDEGSAIGLSGEGTEENPYQIGSLKDLFRIRYVGVSFTNDTDSAYYALTADLDMTGLDVIPSIDGLTYRGGVMRGEFAFLNAQADTVFASGYAIKGENVGFLSSNASSVCGLLTDVNDNTYDFGYSDDKEEETASPSASLEGSGTAADPYIVNSAEDVAAVFELDSGYAVLNADIALNSHYYDKRFNLPSGAENRVDFNGNGHSIIGLFDSLFASNAGNVYNLTVRGYEAASLICASNSGTIDGVKTFGTVTSAGVADLNSATGTIKNCVNYASGAVDDESNPYTTYAFCRENIYSADKVLSCINYGAVTYAFPENKGARDCINYGEVTENEAGNFETCVDEYNDVIYYNGNISDLDYKTLLSSDKRKAFGYPVGGSTVELRKSGKSYKTELKKPFNTDFGLDFDVYSPSKSYLIKSAEGEIATAATEDGTRFSWTFAKWDEEAQAFDGTVIQNAGIYTVVAEFGGNDDYFPATAKITFEIEKAAAPSEIKFASGAFAAVELEYTGVRQTVAAVIPSNVSELGEKGYGEPIFALRDGSGEEVMGALYAGGYSQTVSLVADNYETVTAARAVTVTQKSLTVKVGDLTCDYGEEIDLSRALFELVGLVENDEGLSASELFGLDYAVGLTTDYYAGADAGEDKYVIDFTATARNYKIDVESGKITVNTVDIPLSAIDFYGATKTKKGERSIEYTGEIIELQATVADWLNVEYTNNYHKSVTTADGVEVKATFSQKTDNGEVKNYNDVTLTAILIITPAPLTVKANGGSSNYGESVDLGGYSLIGVKNGEASEIRSALTVVCKLFDGDSEVTESVPTAKQYTVKLTAEGSLENYLVTTADGSYTINKVKLYRLFNNNISGQNSDFDDESKEYDGIAVTKSLPYFADGSLYAVASSVTKDGNAYSGEIKNAGRYVYTAVVTPKGTAAENYEATEYVCIVTVRKKQSNLQFEQSAYEKIYASENFALIEYYDYSGEYSPSAEPVLTCENSSGATVGEAVNADKYTLVLTVAETENYEGATARAALEILPKSVTAEFEYEYVYTGQAVVPVLKGAIDGVVGGEIDGGDLSYSVYSVTDTELVTPINAINATEYVFTVRITNPNYSLPPTTYRMRIKPQAIPIELGELRVIYGTVGEAAIGDATYYVSRNGDGMTLTRRNFQADEDTLIPAVDFIIPSVNVNSEGYMLTDASIRTSGNFTVTFKENTVNKVVVARRSLGIVWSVDGRNYNGSEISIPYAGYSQSDRFDFTVTNIASWDNASDLHLEKKLSGDGKEFLHAGNYEYSVELRDDINYIVDAAPLRVTVNKLIVYVTVRDVEMPAGEQFVRGSLEFGVATGQGSVMGGLVAADRNKSPEELFGASVAYQTTYTEVSAVGTKHPLTVRATFADYTAEIVKTGEITVVRNPYPDYRLSNVTFTYDGQIHKVEIENVMQGVSVVYTPTNSFRDAGEYNLSAVITYPTGRRTSTSCKVYVRKATPTVSVEPLQILYSENKVLGDELLNYVAYANGNVQNAVAGTTEFVKTDGEGPTLAMGEYLYDYIFIPDDTRNFETVVGKVTIISDEVGFANLKFGEGIVTLDVNNGTMSINRVVTIELNESILTGLKLYRDDFEVTEIILTKTEDVKIAVKLGTETAFEIPFKITFIEQSGGEQQELGVEMLAFSGARLEGGTIYVTADGGYLALAENFKNNYNLMVNGEFTSEYRIKGNETRISVIVRAKNGSVNLEKSWWFNVELTVEKDEPKISNTTLYIIIGCGAGGLALVIAVVLIIWKKKNG